MQGPGSRLYLLRRVHTIKIPFSMAHGHAVQMFFFWLAMTFIIFIYFPFAFSSHFHFNIAALFFLSSLFVLSFFFLLFLSLHCVPRFVYLMRFLADIFAIWWQAAWEVVVREGRASGAWQLLPKGWAVQFESFPLPGLQLLHINPAATKTNYNLKLFFQHSKTTQSATRRASPSQDCSCNHQTRYNRPTVLLHLELNATKYHPGSGRGSSVA